MLWSYRHIIKLKQPVTKLCWDSRCPGDSLACVVATVFVFLPANPHPKDLIYQYLTITDLVALENEPPAQPRTRAQGLIMTAWLGSLHLGIWQPMCPHPVNVNQPTMPAPGMERQSSWALLLNLWKLLESPALRPCQLGAKVLSLSAHEFLDLYSGPTSPPFLLTRSPPLLKFIFCI